MNERLHPTLAGHFYADPAIFALERKRIFDSSWQWLATERSLAEAGSFVTINIAGAALFAIRGEDGALRAFRNACRHRGARLLDDAGSGCNEIRCPYHDWRYALDGRLTDTPWFGEESPFDLTALSLTPAAIEVWRGLVFVAVDPRGSLLEQLGDLPHYLATTRIEEMVEEPAEVRRAHVNWKAYLDQYTEYYHSPAVHMPDKAVGIEHYSAVPFDGGMVMRSPPGAAFYGGQWLWSWPNLTLATFDGGVKLSRILPLSAGECEVSFAFLFDAATDPAQRQRVIDATMHIFAEDIEAVSRVQANYAAGLFEEPGPLHPRHEAATAYFQRLVREALA